MHPIVAGGSFYRFARVGRATLFELLFLVFIFHLLGKVLFHFLFLPIPISFLLMCYFWRFDKLGRTICNRTEHTLITLYGVEISPILCSDMDDLRRSIAGFCHSSMYRRSICLTCSDPKRQSIGGGLSTCTPCRRQVDHFGFPCRDTPRKGTPSALVVAVLLGEWAAAAEERQELSSSVRRQ